MTFNQLRFPLKLMFAVLLALFVGFHFHLETPRWAVITAGVVAGGTAFVAGGEPWSGALRYRGMLRIIGTFAGCIAALTLMISTIRAPIVLMLLCCIWTGMCVWLSSLIKVENAYALGLAGYTALIIIVTVKASGQLTQAPEFAVERCSEIVIGIICVIVADLLFSPRSIKAAIDREIELLLIAQYKLLQLCVAHGSREEIDHVWRALVSQSSALNNMRSNLIMESAHWQRVDRRLKRLNTLSLMLITQAGELFLIQNDDEQAIAMTYREYIKQDVGNIKDVCQRIKGLRRRVRPANDEQTPLMLSAWVEAASQYLLLMEGIQRNSRIGRREEEILTQEVIVKARSAETHQAMINGLRTFVATSLASLFWLYTGWTSGAGCMIQLAVITALAMRTPNPLRMANDFLFGMTVAIPLGALYFMLILPATQQSMLLLMIALGVLSFVAGIFIQRRQFGSMGAFVGTLNVLVLDNPMSFTVNTYLDSALGQVIGCFVALLVILLIRNKSKARTGRTLLSRFMAAAVSAMTTNKFRRRENHLPALYQQLFLLLTLFPEDMEKYRLALTLIISHQRLRSAKIPVNPELSMLHKRLRRTADDVIIARSDDKRRYYYRQLLKEFKHYQQRLSFYDAPASVKEAVQRLADMLKKYQNAFLKI